MTDIEWQAADSNSINKGQNFHAGRQKQTAALISNCNDKNGRLEYIKQLAKHSPVDIFGECGQPCPNKFANGSTGPCRHIVLSEYKFILAFENSDCPEYITEKFFLALAHDIVPVVRGGGDYEIYVPRSGFIQTKEFAEVKQLADRLNYLNVNATAYNEYFKWKQYVRIGTERPTVFCSICVHLHLERELGISRGVLDNLETYWNKGDCQL